MNRTLALAALAVASPLLAQTTPNLIGLTRNVPMILAQDFTTCAVTRCLPVMPNAAGLPPYAGGTAYDSTNGGVWVTNGLLIGEFDPDFCRTLCTPFPIPGTSPNVVATGLAYNENTGQMFVSDSQNNIRVFKIACAAMTLISTCQTWPVTTSNPTIGGIATSDAQGYVYYAASMWSGAPNNTLFIAKQTSPCAYFCKIAVPSCGPIVLGPITGVAYDDCKDVCWCTDGQNAVALRINHTACTATQVQCCNLGAIAEPYIGLCIEPSHATTTDQSTASKSCTSAPCAFCPGMLHDTLGDAAIGNPSFTLRLTNAPAMANGYLLINSGGCSSPGVPFGCGQLFLPLVPAPIVVGFPTGGGAGCTGGHTLSLTVPMVPAFCGVVLSSQYAIICVVGAGIGTGLSNCLSWAISAT